ncbi:MAG: glycerophosphodiester phosphodiesterase [Clostridia bacterium]|nr:glycerophosphodiester phosphodiesterase [Clostridia bacterium]
MPYRIGKQFGAGNPIVAAHRGFSACYPENTLIAFEKAAELGVDMVELDISMSSDGIPMLYHDDILEKKSSPLTGSVQDYTHEQLAKVQIGRKIGMEDAPVATLEEFCKLYSRYPDIAVDIDLKPGCGVDATIRPVMEILYAYGFEDRCIFNSLDGEITRYLHSNTGFLTVGPPNDFPGNVNHIPGINGTYATLDAVCMPTKLLNRENADALREMGKIVVSAPVPDEAAAKHALDCGVIIALCDDPRPMLKLLGRL